MSLSMMLRRIPEILVLLATLGFAVYGMALLAYGCHDLLAPPPLPPEQAEATQARLISQAHETPVSCELSAQVLVAVEAELSVLHARLEPKAEDDPAVFVLGTEFIAVKRLEDQLRGWQDRNGCSRS